MDISFLVRHGKQSVFFTAITEVDISFVEASGSNLLQLALAGRSTAICLELVRRGVDVNGKNRDGETPLH
ncbi:MAG TPA: hypothetical protein VLX85_00915 [Stellaceae bacterium]|nr:hypothetical protein [Stellaceae bacterium]